MNKNLILALSLAAFISVPCYAENNAEYSSTFEFLGNAAPSQEYANAFLNLETKNGGNTPQSVKDIKRYFTSLVTDMQYMLDKSEPGTQMQQKTLENLAASLKQIKTAGAAITGISTTQETKYKQLCVQVQALYKQLKSSGISFEDKGLSSMPNSKPAGKGTTFDQKLDKANQTLEATQNVLIAVDEIVQTGSDIYQIVKDNAAIVNVETNYATAMPKGTSKDDWRDFTGWKHKSVAYKLQISKWLMGYKVDANFKVSYMYGGSYFGTGKYLTGVTIEPTYLKVDSGYSLNVKFQAMNVRNVSKPGQEPMGAMDVKITYRLTSSGDGSKSAEDNVAIFTILANGDCYETSASGKMQAK